MKDFDLLRFLHPHLKFGEEIEDLFERIHHVISWFDLLFLEERYECWLIRFYGLISSLKKEEAEEICQRLSIDDKMRKRVVYGTRQGDQALLQIFSWINEGYQPKRSEIYDVLDPLSIEIKLFMMAKTTQMTTRRYISLYFTQLKDARPLLKGSDLIRMGIKPGPSIKKTLVDLLKARLDERVVTPQDEIEYVSREHGIR
jgi:tRNA nucleotidyltransferase (CCA-adding enzyme)